MSGPRVALPDWLDRHWLYPPDREDDDIRAHDPTPPTHQGQGRKRRRRHNRNRSRRNYDSVTLLRAPEPRVSGTALVGVPHQQADVIVTHSVTECLQGDGRKAFFPRVPNAVAYEVIIEGAITLYRRYSPNGTGYAEEAFITIDALSFESKYGLYGSERSGSHPWLLIGDQSFETRRKGNHLEVLSADYATHEYRFRINVKNLDGSQLTLSLDVPGTLCHMTPSNREGCLKVSARALLQPAQAEERARPPKPKAADIRERMRRHIKDSGRDFAASLHAIADEHRNLVTSIENRKDLTETVRRDLVQEADAWAARELERLTGDRRSGGDDVKRI